MKISPLLIAAIDLGSNSFRLTFSQIKHAPNDDIKVIQTIRKTVCLAAGLESNMLLNQASIIRGLKVIQCFGKHLTHIQPKLTYAVATSTLRQARNAQEFLLPAEQILNCPIKVISGQEEAHLIYLGTVCQISYQTEKFLVIDIGGGSTELIIGNKYASQLMESVNIGCISHTHNFFPYGQIDATAMYQAEIATQQIVNPFLSQYLQAGWSRVLASSGAAQTIAKVLEENNLNYQTSSSKNTGNISRTGLIRLKNLLIEAKQISNLHLKGLDTDRVTVFVGGLAIMLGLFNAFNIDFIETVNDALSLGIIKNLNDDLENISLNNHYYSNSEMITKVSIS